MSIDKALENMKFDVRLIDYHLNNGVITKADIEKHSKDLPDLSANVALPSDTDNEVEVDVDDESGEIPQAH